MAFFRNCGSISKIAAPAFEMMMNSRVASVKQIVKIESSHNFCKVATIFVKLKLDRGVGKKKLFEGGKTP